MRSMEAGETVSDDEGDAKDNDDDDDECVLLE